jgi:hypothetical protein
MSERTYAPRSGGRTTEQRAGTIGSRRRSTTGSDARGARRYPTQGATALKVDTAVAEPLRATDAPAPRLRVAPPAPISAPRAPFIAVVIALVIAGVLGILLINTKTNENSFEISRLQDQQTALDTRQQQLDNQLATYDSVGNLDAAAKRLGLVKADAPAYIRLPDGKVIGVPKPGTGQPAVTAQDAADVAAAAKGGTATGGATADSTTPQGTAQQGSVQQGTAQQGSVQEGTAQQGTAQQGTVQQGTVQQGTAQHGTVQQGTVQQGTAQPGAAEQGGVQQGAVQQRGVVQQPVAGQ